MLVLTRKPDEIVVIGDNIVVKVVAINGNKVRLGFAAPPELPIHRQEIAERIARDRDRDRKPVSCQR